MKSLVLQNRKVWAEDVATPVPERDWVVVKIEAAPICGSDKGAFSSEKPVRLAGHEASGVVAETAGSSVLKKGDRVILNPLSGCGKCYLCIRGDYLYCPVKSASATYFAQYARIQDFVCTLLPDDISYEIGALACCTLGPAFNSIKRMGLKAFDTLIITGLGPVGMGALTIAKFMGARVVALDTIPFRKKMAMELGADAVIDAADPDAKRMIAEAVAPGVATRALDASGSHAAQRLLIDAMAPTGIVAFVGENEKDLSVSPSKDFIRKGLTIIGTWHYNIHDRENMLSVLRRSPILPKLISGIYGFSKAQEAFDRFIGGDVCKIILNPWN
jgi:threonine dehydrogenase-like Zn-dependent dehydrogenase